MKSYEVHGFGSSLSVGSWFKISSRHAGVREGSFGDRLNWRDVVRTVV